MAAPANQTDSAAINVALDQEFIASYTQEFDRLAEVMGLFGVETMPAGASLYQLKIDGALNNAKADDSSSGTAYVEGDLVALSKFTAKKVPVGDITGVPYRKQTTAAAIQKSGYDVAVLRTDRKMLSLVRAQDVGKFFSFLANGTGAAEGVGLQAALAKADAALADALEDNDDNGGTPIHFLNRQDCAEYLGKAEITTQTVYGMTYIQNFLGIERAFLSSKVPAGTFYVTTAENVHAYGLDFSELSTAGLPYEAQSSGLIGVAHTPAYDHVSVDTNVLSGCLLLPEVQEFDYQSIRHCSKTRGRGPPPRRAFDYQSIRHCSKTTTGTRAHPARFDYQSIRHCSKTPTASRSSYSRLITSRFDTAPKRARCNPRHPASLITSRFDTAPKLAYGASAATYCLITSRFDTAPKLIQRKKRGYL